MTDIILNVQPDQLVSKASELQSQRTQINSLMDEAKHQVTSLSSVWDSGASTEYQNKFKQIYDDIDNALKIVDEYVSDLNDVANTYKQAESQATTQSQGLPTDGVFTV